MGKNDKTLETIRAALAPYGLFMRGIVHFEGDGPEMAAGERAGTVVLVGNVGGSMWQAFSEWHERAEGQIENPLDQWSADVIRPVAKAAGGQAYFPSEKPWQPFQQWAMRAEGLKASPLGVLIHPKFGLWHGYRGAIGFAGKIGMPTVPFEHHACDRCADKPCLTTCPVRAVAVASFSVPACRNHLRAPEGKAGCMVSGCLARNACPVGAEFRYPEAQLRFHMAALS
jgi:hypothetical protein